jgi:hypothetical protein
MSRRAWGGERNYRGVVPVQGEDPFAAEGYTTPAVGVKLEERTKPDNRGAPTTRIRNAFQPNRGH